MVTFKQVSPLELLPWCQYVKKLAFSILQIRTGYCAHLPFSQFKHSWLSTLMHFLVCQSCCFSDFFLLLFKERRFKRIWKRRPLDSASIVQRALVLSASTHPPSDFYHVLVPLWLLNLQVNFFTSCLIGYFVKEHLVKGSRLLKASLRVFPCHLSSIQPCYFQFVSLLFFCVLDYYFQGSRKLNVRTCNATEASETKSVIMILGSFGNKSLLFWNTLPSQCCR